jgi:xanthine dehydrogenase YagT iron-sulfur-binding subunit
MSMQTETIEIGLSVNGRSHRLAVPPSATLLEVLHDFLALTGTKKGCDMGSCGACTVLIDGRRVNACLALAVQQEGRVILSIEGVAGDGGALHPLQAAFIARDALQCGYCTPGQIMSALGLMAEGSTSSESEIREGMSGNLCRCGAYANIVSAILDVAKDAASRPA